MTQEFQNNKGERHLLKTRNIFRYIDEKWNQHIDQAQMNIQLFDKHFTQKNKRINTKYTVDKNEMLVDMQTI